MWGATTLRSQPSLSRRLASAAVLGLACLVGRTSAGYVTVGMTQAIQCNTSTVQWYGDDGPYHLLLTPTTIVEHGYNVWIESIPNGTTSVDVAINQPAGLQYMVTVWGISGIEYAGTTDVLTVAASPTSNSSCFLTDAQILSLYTFSFNISNTDDGFPPQCSNLTMTWPTSLESNVTGTEARRRRRRATNSSVADLDLDIVLDQYDTTVDEDDASSSKKTSGNTTSPPTMFGIIPLGNSFSIPITYSTQSNFASSLPAASLSTTPTTWTSQGVTYLNWTTDLAKGTRFILVAGIGSLEEWASGGSSAMMTVGQGTTGCLGSESDDGSAPSITATGTSTGALPEVTDDAGGGGSSSQPQKKSASWVGVIIACVFSALATLLLVALFWCGCRIRRRRRDAMQHGLVKPSVLYIISLGRFGRSGGGVTGVAGAARTDPKDRYGEPTEPADTQLDLIASRDNSSETSDSSSPPRLGAGGVTRLVTDAPLRRDSPAELTSPTDGSSSEIHNGGRREFNSPPYPLPSRSHTANTSEEYYHSSASYASPISPTRDRPDLRGDFMARQSSQDALLSYHSVMSASPVDSGTGISSLRSGSRSRHGGAARRGPLVLHDSAGAIIDDDRDVDDDSGARESLEDDIGDLKRDTLSYLSNTTSPSGSISGPASRTNTGTGASSHGSSTPVQDARRRRRERDEETSYVVHRDAGRVVPPTRAPPAGRVLELPPRYEELNWDNDGGAPGAPSGVAGDDPLLPQHDAGNSGTAEPTDGLSATVGPGMPPPSLAAIMENAIPPRDTHTT